MKCIQSIDDLHLARGGAVTIGNFDGVHHGHRTLIDRLKSKAQQHHGPAVVFTFEPHPVRVLRPDQAPAPLTWTTRKAQLLGEIGVDLLIAYPTTHELLGMPPETFFQKIVVEALDARAMVEGPNFHFGRQRTGDIHTLGRLCDQHSVQLDIVTPCKRDGTLISSSRIRKAIAQGQVDRAAEMLTKPYRMRGMVTHGAARGRAIGFPTANLEAIDTLIPAHGVYAGRAIPQAASDTSGRFSAAIHIGPNPTFGEKGVKVEVHLLDFDQDLYGQPLEVEFVKPLRPIRPFESVDALIAQLKTDIAATRVATSR